MLRIPHFPTRSVLRGDLLDTFQTLIPASLLVDVIKPPGTDYTHAMVETPWFCLSNTDMTYNFSASIN